jgi:hypothetical protein
MSQVDASIDGRAEPPVLSSPMVIFLNRKYTVISTETAPLCEPRSGEYPHLYLNFRPADAAPSKLCNQHNLSSSNRMETEQT